LRAARTYLKKGERSEHCDDELDERRRKRGRKGEGWRAARRAAHLASAECDDQRHGSASAASAAVANKRKGGGRREGKGEGLRASPRCALRTWRVQRATNKGMAGRAQQRALRWRVRGQEGDERERKEGGGGEERGVVRCEARCSLGQRWSERSERRLKSRKGERICHDSE